MERPGVSLCRRSPGRSLTGRATGQDYSVGASARIPPAARSNCRYIRGLLEIGGRHGAIAGAAASTPLPRFGSRACQHLCREPCSRCAGPHRSRVRRGKKAVPAAVFAPLQARMKFSHRQDRLSAGQPAPMPLYRLAPTEAQRASRDAQVAQLVEHATENRSVGGSIPPLGTISLYRAIISSLSADLLHSRRQDEELCGEAPSFHHRTRDKGSNIASFGSSGTRRFRKGCAGFPSRQGF